MNYRMIGRVLGLILMIYAALLLLPLSLCREFLFRLFTVLRGLRLLPF